jgi:hypothetical protein
MSDAATLTGKDHFVFVLDEVDSAGIRIDEERAIAPAAASAATRLGDDDVRNTFRIWPSRSTYRRRSAPAAPATVASPRGNAGQQLGGRNHAIQATEAADTVRIDANPIPFEPDLRRLSMHYRRRREGQQKCDD